MTHYDQKGGHFLAETTINGDTITGEGPTEQAAVKDLRHTVTVRAMKHDIPTR